ncbi:hypothetical protein CBR_g26238 [Chara braunii]|uniref:Cyclic nucleotide-binding domain-containing protein n=1 Tax=Chara braunii TaxID=69332 RepID=A0A388L7C9_CHABU|nr:hypothetical protein CBR_g26238 [Chara braunii]|eukprot:GBG78205.1 hypothetical protein CBR_g26238 [Chara braunii]
MESHSGGIADYETVSKERDSPPSYGFYDANTISRLGPGSFFGEGCIFRKLRRDWIVEAATHVKAYQINKMDFLQVVPPDIKATLEEEATFRMLYFDGRLYRHMPVGPGIRETYVRRIRLHIKNLASQKDDKFSQIANSGQNNNTAKAVETAVDEKGRKGSISSLASTKLIKNILSTANLSRSFSTGSALETDGMGQERRSKALNALREDAEAGLAEIERRQKRIGEASLPRIPPALTAMKSGSPKLAELMGSHSSPRPSTAPAVDSKVAPFDSEATAADALSSDLESPASPSDPAGPFTTDSPESSPRSLTPSGRRDRAHGGVLTSARDPLMKNDFCLRSPLAFLLRAPSMLSSKVLKMTGPLRIPIGDRTGYPLRTQTPIVRKWSKLLNPPNSADAAKLVPGGAPAPRLDSWLRSHFQRDSRKIGAPSRAWTPRERVTVQMMRSPRHGMVPVGSLNAWNIAAQTPYGTTAPGTPRLHRYTPHTLRTPRVYTPHTAGTPGGNSLSKGSATNKRTRDSPSGAMPDAGVDESDVVASQLRRKLQTTKRWLGIQASQH